jgi:hypothetical protein
MNRNNTNNNIIYLDLPEYSPRKSYLNLDLCDAEDNYPEEVFSMEKLYQTTENEINIEGEMNDPFNKTTSIRGSGDKFQTKKVSGSFVN